MDHQSGRCRLGVLTASRFDSYLSRCRFPSTSERVTCAVSGGADSLALLVLAREVGLSVEAVHVDHGLRPGSGGEADLVAEAARSLGADFRSVTAEVGCGPNLEERARDARYAVLPSEAMLGHTADDQAETVLLNLLRGSGLAGAAAMRADLRRPLLGLRRSETAEVCRKVGLKPFCDPSNSDPAFRRNRVRREVLPLLNDVFQRDVVPLLCRHAELAREAVEALDGLSADVDAADCRALAELPPVLASWAIRRWVVSVSGSAHPPDRAAVGRVLDVAAGKARAAEVGSHWRVRRSGGGLFLEDESPLSARSGGGEHSAPGSIRRREPKGETGGG